MSIARTTGADPAFVALTRRLDAELWNRYGDVQAVYDVHNAFVAEHAVIARAGTEPVGCGCIKRFDAETAELKRMFVAAEHRGEGIGRALVGALEVWARELGYSAIVLETGVLQPDAIRLYEVCGFARIESYEPYIGMATSVCMRKSLAA